MKTDSLPIDYKQTGEFNLKNNTRMMLILNVAGILLFFGAAFLLPFYIRLVRPADAAATLSFSIDNLAQLGLFILFLAIDFTLLIILHEGVHGICFWLITGKRPVFAIGAGYAYAAAPEVFISKKPYLITAISPLVVLTTTGLLLIPFISAGLLFHVGFITVMNIAGAVGDLWVSGGLVFRSEPLLVQDSGDRVIVYQPGL